jgi:hypothetical protein
MASGVQYTVSVWSVDGAGSTSSTTTRTYTYDTKGPTVASADLTSTNKNGTVNATKDTFSVTFNEPLRATTVPATAALTISRSNGVTSYGITGLTNGLRSTGGTGYLGSSASTRLVAFTGTLALSNGNKTVTFTVTGACVGACTARTSVKSTGAFQFVGAPSLRDLAGNAPSTATVSAAPQILF